MISERELNDYYKAVSKALRCDRKQKQAFMNELQANVNDFIISEPDATTERIYAAFGAPDEIAAGFAEANRNALRRRIIKIVLIAVVIALVIYGIFIAASYIDVHTEAHGRIEETVLMINIAGGRFP
ncbi:MAG: hypothetical protein K6G90_12260 [Clostridia bacterium]|nr:hypothetical protein [Clostridia bacterium]